MFENLQEKLSQAFKEITGKARLSEDNISDVLRKVRLALLDADVALPVVKEFLEKVKVRALGTEIINQLNPSQAFIKILNEELTAFMGGENASLNEYNAPNVILMAGLQGAGKTTTSAKLAKYLKDNNKKVMLVSADVYRAAAIEQLRTLSKDLQIDFFESDNSQKPLQIANNALKQAKLSFYDYLIIDTAGRLTVDEEMMQEIKELHKELRPSDTLFVLDAMTGQDAVNTAKAFNDAVDLTGVILTKMDGDARGGAALSVKWIIGKPIKFIGTGEKTTALEVFHPDRIASRILGMGDVLSLIEQVANNTDLEKSKKLTQKLKKGKGFNLEDFQEQMQQMSKMGGIASFMDKMPSFGGVNLSQLEGANDVAEKRLKVMNAIINSMTPKERRNPDLMNGSRKKRVAAGCGLQVQDVNRLLKEHKQMQKMMSAFTAKGGMAKMMRGMGKIIPGNGFKF